MTTAIRGFLTGLCLGLVACATLPPPPPPPVDDPSWPQQCRDIWHQEAGLTPDQIPAGGVAECVAWFRARVPVPEIRRRIADQRPPDEPPAEDPPIHRPAATIPGRSIGASYYTAATDPRIDPEAFAVALDQVDVTFTRAWLIDAWAVGPNGPGQYAGFLPVERTADGRFDLTRWDEGYFKRIRTFADAMNQHRIVPLFTILELYAWSERKAGLLWVPDANLGPFRRNANGVRWGAPDDPTFETLPDDFLRGFLCRVVDTLRGASWVAEIGNEMPEKPMHYRIRDALRACGYTGEITVNRQEDTPGQYANMAIGRDFDRISFHGKGTIEYLDEDFPNEPVFRTFRQFFGSTTYTADRIIFSSDGCRKSTSVTDAYDYPRLTVVARDALARGFSYEHQLALKLRGFTEGRVDVADVAIDAPFLAGIR